MPHVKIGFTAAILAAALSQSASAALITYTGEDIVEATTSPHPVSTAAAASFDAAVSALGGGSLITFEGTALGSFSNLAVAPGVALSGTDHAGANQTIRNTSNSPSFPTLDGFNTTPGGAYFVEVQGGTLTFSFASPVQAFGAYFSGLQAPFFADTVTFSDGTSQTVSIPEAGTSSSVGALSFAGFTDAGKSIASVTVNAGAPNSSSSGEDFIGVDDVRYQLTSTIPSAPTTTPEPTSLALMLTGLGAVLGFAARAHSRRSDRYPA